VDEAIWISLVIKRHVKSHKEIGLSWAAAGLVDTSLR